MTSVTPDSVEVTRIFLQLQGIRLDVFVWYLYILIKGQSDDCSVSVKVSRSVNRQSLWRLHCVARVPLASGRDFGQESDQGGSE